MDKTHLLSAEGKKFMAEHEHADLQELLLQREKYRGIPLTDLIEQIRCRQKARTKLPEWYRKEGVLFASPLAVEQASSEIAAKFKASLVLPGKQGLDLSGGLGIDSYYLSGKFDRWHYVEANEALASLSQDNFKLLGRENITVSSGQAEDFLLTASCRYDLVYIDPDRRSGDQKVRSFRDSKPNLLSLLAKVEGISDRLLVKASPMLDLSLAIDELRATSEVIIVAIDNEVKELLFDIDFTFSRKPSVRCININKGETSSFSFDPEQELQEFCVQGELEGYLYEPNAAIMKAGAFNSIGLAFGLQKLQRNTHLYTSSRLIRDFPGRVFYVLGKAKYRQKEIKALVPEGKANLAVRNFTDSAVQMKKRLGLKDGGNRYIFGYRDLKNRNRVAVCQKIDN